MYIEVTARQMWRIFETVFAFSVFRKKLMSVVFR